MCSSELRTYKYEHRSQYSRRSISIGGGDMINCGSMYLNSDLHIKLGGNINKCLSGIPIAITVTSVTMVGIVGTSVLFEQLTLMHCTYFHISLSI